MVIHLTVSFRLFRIAPANTFDQLEPHSISPIITQAFINPYHPATGENCQVLVQVEDDGSVGM